MRLPKAKFVFKIKNYLWFAETGAGKIWWFLLDVNPVTLIRLGSGGRNFLRLLHLRVRTRKKFWMAWPPHTHTAHSPTLPLLFSAIYTLLTRFLWFPLIIATCTSDSHVACNSSSWTILHWLTFDLNQSNFSAQLMTLWTEYTSGSVPASFSHRLHLGFLLHLQGMWSFLPHRLHRSDQSTLFSHTPAKGPYKRH